MKDFFYSLFPPGPLLSATLVGYSKAWLLQQKLRGYPHLHSIFLKMVGYPLDLNHPKTHNHFLNWIKFHRKSPLVAVTSDKVLVRDYIKNQEEHHSKKSFQKEYDEFIEKFGFQKFEG